MHGAMIGDLAIVMVVAALTGLLMRRIGQPNVLGYLLAGLIVGPYIPIPLFADPHRVEDLAEVGVVLVMFAVGLEFRVRRLLAILPLSGLTAAVQMGALAWCGYTVASVLGWSTAASVTLGSTLAISSTMVVSAVLRTRPVDPEVRSHVFGVLVVQDVVAIVLIAVVTALAAGRTLEAGAVGLLVAQLAAVVTAMLVGGLLLVPRLVRWTLSSGDSEALVVLVAGAAFGLALVADLFGYSVALGAFLAGMLVAESGRGHEVEHAIEPLRAVFSAIFFVSIGMAVDPFVAWTTLPLALALCAVVIVAQLLSVGLGSILSGSSLRNSVLAGLALGQIGELSFILASIAISGGVVPDETLPVLVTVATVTAFTTPMLLARGDRLVSMIDRAVPDRATAWLAAYQAFVRRLREPGPGPSLRRPAIALVLDWAALVVLVVAGRVAVASHLGQEWAVTLRVVEGVVAIPFLVGLARSGLQLSRVIRATVRSGAAPSAVSRAIETAALLTVLLAVGTPTVAILRPVLSRSWLEIGLLGAVLVVAIVLLSRISGMEEEYTSGVARIASGLARHVGEEGEPGKRGMGEGPLAGLDFVSIAVPSGAAIDGSTLAELDLRCRTGATVVAICRGEETLVLPTGHERVRSDDTLAVSGSDEAVERARAILSAPRPEDNAGPSPAADGRSGRAL